MTKKAKLITGAVKLIEKDIKNIRLLYRQKVPVRLIAKLYGISDVSVYYWVNTKYRLKVIERSRRISREIWKTDNGKKETRKRTQRIWMRRKRKEPKFREYLNQRYRIRRKLINKIYKLYKLGKLIIKDI